MATVPTSPPPPEASALSPFDLNLRHLRGLLEVGERGSISAAVRTLGLSQPALTQGLAKLEAQLGQPLFERLPHGMRLTDAGGAMAERTRSAMQQFASHGRQLIREEFLPDRRLTMAQVRAFLALVQAGSFAGASARTGLSQTAVTRAVRELEATLQKALVERRGRGVQVNFSGRRFARGCRLAVAELQAAFIELGIAAQASRIAVGTTPLARAYLVPEAMAAMAAQAAEGHAAGFQVLEGSWAELVEALRDGAIDLIVGELPDHESPDLLKTPLRQEALVIVGGFQHPLAGVHAVSLERLRTYPWIVGPENSPMRQEWQRLFARGPLPAAPVECGSIMVIGRLLTSSPMLTLATPDQVALQIRSGLLARVGAPLDAHQHLMGVTMRQSWRPTSAQQQFLAQLRTAAGRSADDTPGITERWNQ